MCDRFCDSTLVYQHYGVGLSKKLIMDEIEKISLEPDLTIVLSAPWEVCLDRRNQRNAGAKSDRYESLDDSFSKRVYDGYLELASANQHRCIIVDANRTPSVVAEDIFSIVSLVMINKGKLNAAPDFAARMRF
jgi:dTMP kinase